MTRRFLPLQPSVGPIRFGLRFAAAVTTMLLAAPAWSQEPHRRIPQPGVVVSPSKAEIRAGDSLLLEATPSGGEAIRFSVEWEISRGANLGSLFVEPPRDGEMPGMRVHFTANRNRSGTVIILARLKQYPAATAQAEVHVAHRRDH